MEYNFREIEQKWQAYWKENKTYQVEIDKDKPKFYVLDMFPYPSGAGLHVGHPLGYIASDIYSRYKRLKGFNVLHPMGYDAYGLPAEQYAIQTGQHPAITTEKNINRYREQLDKIGFSFDWNREIRTCDPEYYKWTQWAFIQMFNSYYNYELNIKNKELGAARPVSELIAHFEKFGTENLNVAQTEQLYFTAEEWNAKTEREQQEILMNYRIAYLAETTVNWCEQLGTVLANDEVQDGLSVRGGYPVVQRKMKQWSLRVSAYAQRLLEGLETIDWSESIKETQRNWIGRSEGAEIIFNLPPAPAHNWNLLIDRAKQMRSQPTEAESILWDMLREKQTGYKFRRQHPIDMFIPDFVCLSKKLIIEIDGDYHLTDEQKELDEIRTEMLNDWGYAIIRFSDEEVIKNPHAVVEAILSTLEKRTTESPDELETTPHSLSFREGRGGLLVFTTRADTIYGVTFMVLAPESEYVKLCVTDEQKAEVEKYLEQVKRRTERERIADRKVTGVFSGSYAINPISKTEIPIYISDYVLAGYGTGAIMAVPAHDSRDYAFAKHFNLPIIPLIEGADLSEESFDAKEGIMCNSPITNHELRITENQLVLNGLTVKEAIEKTKKYITENNLGKVKVNYRLRDAIFSRQRYWGEPFPVYYKDGMPYAVEMKDLPIELPEVDKFLPTETGEPPLGRAKGWEYEKK
jgi:leucyl-tRNA synthetase